MAGSSVAGSNVAGSSVAGSSVADTIDFHIPSFTYTSPGEDGYIHWAEIEATTAQFLFGDNTAHYGCGGQAGSMRPDCQDPKPNRLTTKGTPIGVATLNADDSCWCWKDTGLTSNLASNIKSINDDFALVNPMESTIVPGDGLGTGIADLNTSAPKTFIYLQVKLATLKIKTGYTANFLTKLKHSEALKPGVINNIYKKLKKHNFCNRLGRSDRGNVKALKRILKGMSTKDINTVASYFNKENKSYKINLNNFDKTDLVDNIPPGTTRATEEAFSKENINLGNLIKQANKRSTQPIAAVPGKVQLTISEGTHDIHENAQSNTTTDEKSNSQNNFVGTEMNSVDASQPRLPSTDGDSS